MTPSALGVSLGRGENWGPVQNSLLERTSVVGFVTRNTHAFRGEWDVQPILSPNYEAFTWPSAVKDSSSAILTILLTGTDSQPHCLKIVRRVGIFLDFWSLHPDVEEFFWWYLVPSFDDQLLVRSNWLWHFWKARSLRYGWSLKISHPNGNFNTILMIRIKWAKSEGCSFKRHAMLLVGAIRRSPEKLRQS